MLCQRLSTTDVGDTNRLTVDEKTIRLHGQQF